MSGRKFLGTTLEPGKCAYSVYGKKGKDEVFIRSYLNRTRDEAMSIWNGEKDTPAFKSATRAEICCKEKGLGTPLKCKDLK